MPYRKPRFVLAVLLLITSSRGFAASTCALTPAQIAEAPLCPANSKVLPETYPIAALSISDDEGGADWVMAMVEKTLRAQPDRPPQFLLETSSSTIEALKKRINEIAQTPQQREKWLSTLRRVSSTFRFKKAWQQDFYQASFDPRTGMPALRAIETYSGAKSAVESLVEASGECGITKGEPITPAERSIDTFGGSIEGLPPDFCVLGADTFEFGRDRRAFERQACGDKTRIIAAPTKWLETNHVDDLMVTVRTNDPSPCNFAIAIASPQAALDALALRKSDPAFSFAKEKNGISALAAIGGITGFERVCRRYLDNDTVPTQLAQPKGSRKIMRVSPQSPSRMPASDEDRSGYLTAMKRWAWDNKSCAQMTNQDLLDALGPDREFNELVQAQISKFKESLSTALKSALPKCEPKFIDVPNLYTGKVKLDKDGVRRPARASAESLFPNALNAVFVNGTIMTPDPLNQTMQDAVAKSYGRAGVKADFVNTAFAHHYTGNAHCLTQAIRYCRPRESR
jgi:hypothetical protein